MISIDLAKRRLLRVSAVGAAVLFVGCGGGDKQVDSSSATTGAPAATAAPTPTMPTGMTTSPAAIGSPATTGARSLITTTSLAQLADTEIGASFVPEATVSYEFRPLVMNGVSYANAVTMLADQAPRKIEINAGRNRNYFRGTIGIPDDQLSSSSHLIDISLDNAAPALSVVVSFGESKEFDLDVRGVLRIRITVSSLKNRGDVAIGNPRFATA